MQQLIPVALIGWVPITAMLFAILRPHQATAVSMVAGWLLLPVWGYPLPGLPDYSKTTASAFAIAIGVIIKAPGHISRIRLSVYDAPIILWTLSPIVTSSLNGLGIYDGISSSIRELIVWGLPYFAGKIFFQNQLEIRFLSQTIIISGVIYSFFCLLEVRLSPQLNNWVYGFHVNDFVRNIRYEGYRPTVFMANGLMVGMWMMASTILAADMANLPAGEKRSWRPHWLIVSYLFLATIACKATGASLLLIGGMLVLLLVRWTGLRFFFIALAMVPPIYISARLSGTVPREGIITLAAAMTNDDRAQSLEARLIQEDLFGKKALQRPLFGWGGWKRSWPVSADTGKEMTRGVDGFWTIVFGQRGLIGLAAFTSLHLWPTIAICFGALGRRLREPELIPLSSFMLILSLAMIDNLLNGLYNPVFPLISGMLIGIAQRPKIELFAASK
ncbi:hypothetical protein FF011L_48790 [Roseimaritima multifibrata]|uniref:O-Antigen ligase n=1 Tax=Roseimaritima multifibrata TaxID=1930274 RepID=A0A517MMF4_9BACT|nr:hypothetical protein [Roseimaritima multifibrata]QDS96075.1 hypothetical protein FF011L_48790 [Roseimaritima multifibrata]